MTPEAAKLLEASAAETARILAAHQEEMARQNAKASEAIGKPWMRYFDLLEEARARREAAEVESNKENEPSED